MGSLKLMKNYNSCDRIQYLQSKSQFVSEGGQQTKNGISDATLRDAIAGMKEAEGSLTDALNAIFAPPTRKSAKKLGIAENEADDFATHYVERLSRVLDSTGAIERVALGQAVPTHCEVS
jgi:hypothetical protein